MTGRAGLWTATALVAPARRGYVERVRIREILRRKGEAVVTVPPDLDVAGLLRVLAEHRIGAVVVSEDGATVQGIVSERDVVRALHVEGPGVLDSPVRELMTSEVHTCSEGDHIDRLAVTMTEHRVRHLPVLRDGKLVGIVSIGDVVRQRMEELQQENEQLAGYISR